MQVTTNSVALAMRAGTPMNPLTISRVKETQKIPQATGESSVDEGKDYVNGHRQRGIALVRPVCSCGWFQQRIGIDVQQEVTA